MRILIINGPNLNMLCIREPGIYGSGTYADLCSMIEAHAKEIGVEVRVFQSNHEGAIVDEIQSAYGKADGIVTNPAAYRHTSIAILNALKSVAIPAVEIHISDVTKREDFRQISYAGMACEKSFIGLGFDGYLKGIDYLVEKYK